MKPEAQREIARRTLEYLDGNTTALADRTLTEPLDGYLSPETFEAEKRTVFGRYPFFVGLTSDLPGPGSWLTFDATGTSILVSRDKAGTVRAFVNTCRHRGARVVPAGCGVKAHTFTCPFHAWSYGLDGRLLGMPGKEGFSDIRKEDYGLIELPAQERYGLIFVAPAQGTAFSVDEYLGGLAEHFAELGLETWRSVAAVHPHPIAANWKIAWATHLETYHFSYLHKKTAGPLAYGNTGIADFYGDHALMTSTMKTVDTLRDQPQDEWGSPVDDGHINLNYRLFPNLSLSVVNGDRLEIFTIYPGGSINEAVALHYAYRREAPAPEEAAAVEESVRWACQTVVDGEDYWMCSTIDPGLRAPVAPDSFLIGRNEPVLQHLTLALRRVMGTQG
jgi:phenylpropionate dioxygenase-like ring-hydroxylating dioxygenase large terminal subunit